MLRHSRTPNCRYPSDYFLFHSTPSVWYLYHMAEAKLIYHNKHTFQDGAIQEMVLWKLPEKSPERPHGLKYSLFYGLSDGTCLVRYDNELGKGDHRHIGGTEESYTFTDVDTLVGDFLSDIGKVRRRP